MLSKTLSAKHGKAVADPRGEAGKCQRLKPNLTYTDLHNSGKQGAGIGQACCGAQRAAAGHVLQKDTCDQTAVNASDEKDLVGSAIDVQQHESDLAGHEKVHNPRDLPPQRTELCESILTAECREA